MNEIISTIYETQTVIGKSGEKHKLNSQIDPREGRFIFDLIESDQSIVKTLEIGCVYGLSSLHICSALQNRTDASHVIVIPPEHVEAVVDRRE